MSRVAFEVFGNVQGVGFRQFTIDLAKSIGGITGYCRNTSNDTVQGEAQSTNPAILKDFVKGLYEGPGRVDDVKQKEIQQVSGETGFVQKSTLRH
ncbi:Acylphosphatase [Saitoella complicata NRRL Y-17804]|uniref:Acylphosphatase n=1 Tax=Saitoella complicata (strain BCRC 22490 / CBS 7301 / JCM 7358 / NBRC 10748 / NRRL Y-17804) TaxID=698492 RepID=UPI000867BBF7|nr:Acylphosphatase [Saitoella complicata NRRL Y-17804]ODQ49845.1 Acylphosphatase [Saitoella complicata NRRL Y-17804]